MGCNNNFMIDFQKILFTKGTSYGTIKKSEITKQMGPHGMKNLNIMIKPASSMCNLRCKYCFYEEVSARRKTPFCGVMTDETVNRMISKIAADVSHEDMVHFAFQGGEPTLAGLSFFERFIARVASQMPKIKVSYALQTNAVLLDDDWCRFLKEHRFLVGVSLDILPECHDAVRVDRENHGTYRKVLEKLRLLHRYRVDYNILCTLTNAIARHPKQVWNWLTKENISYVQFTPCLGEPDSPKKSPYALTPERFAFFYNQLFSYWYEDYRKGKYRSVKFFDDAVNLLMYGRPTSCGMNGTCQPQLVIEADGSAYPCDFYCLDEFRMGNITEQGPLELLRSTVTQNFLHRPHETPKLCKSCQYAVFCGGNCKRMQKEICCTTDDTYCGYQHFLKENGKTLLEIADRHRKR